MQKEETWDFMQGFDSKNLCHLLASIKEIHPISLGLTKEIHLIFLGHSFFVWKIGTSNMYYTCVLWELHKMTIKTWYFAYIKVGPCHHYIMVSKFPAAIT